MISIQKKNLPKFIRKSDLYEGIDNYEYVFVPNNINIKKIKVNNINDYLKLLNTVSFFGIKITKALKKYQKKNTKEVLAHLHFKEDDAFIKNIIQDLKAKENNFYFTFRHEIDDYNLLIIYLTFNFKNKFITFNTDEFKFSYKKLINISDYKYIDDMTNINNLYLNIKKNYLNINVFFNKNNLAYNSEDYYTYNIFMDEYKKLIIDVQKLHDEIF